MCYDDATSEDLMLLVASGDKRAFSCLVERHRKTVYRIIYLYFKSRQDADDIFQEIFLRIWRSAGSYMPSAKFTTWLYTITANQCRSELAVFWRKSVRLAGTLCGDETEDQSTYTSSSPEDTFICSQQNRQIQQAIRDLPKNQRLALLFSRFEGLSYQEIAEILGCSVSAVESLLFRAKKNLKRKLKPCI